METEKFKNFHKNTWKNEEKHKGDGWMRCSCATLISRNIRSEPFWFFLIKMKTLSKKLVYLLVRSILPLLSSSCLLFLLGYWTKAKQNGYFVWKVPYLWLPVYKRKSVMKLLRIAVEANKVFPSFLKMRR